MLRTLFRSIKWLLLAAVVVGIGVTVLHIHADIPLDDLKLKYAPAPSRFIAMQGMQVHVRDEGLREDSEPVVLLHGTSASLHTWDAWAAGLKKTQRVIRVDLPGFGLTGPQPAGDYSIAAYVRFVQGLLAELKITRCVLVGNSLGGEIAWNTALASPTLVSRLVLIDSAGYSFTPESIPIGFQIARTPVINQTMKLITPRFVIADSVRNVYGEPGLVSEALIDRYFDLTLRAGNRSALVARFAQMKKDVGQLATNPQRIGQIKQPTLILWGARDRLIPPEHGASFRRDIAGSQLVILPKLGHVPHEEGAVETLQAFNNFMQNK